MLTWHARRLGAAVLCLAALACSGEERSAPLSGKGGASSGGTGASASGGSAGAAGAATGGVSGVGADAGSDAEPDATSDANVDAPPPGDGGAIDVACTGNRAFLAGGAAFVHPTPAGLAAAANALTYDVNTHLLTLVLAMKGDGTAVAAASASQVPEGGVAQAFPAAMTPDWVPASVKVGGFTSGGQQKDGWLLLGDQAGEKLIKIENITFAVTTSASCSLATVTLTAVIPASEASVALELATESTTLGKLAGPSNGGSWDLKLLFTAASTDFDFGSS